jgi:DNA-binding CsgD family transcriptional regulator
VEARCRALLHEGPAAEALYTEAVERLGRSRITTGTARAQLLYGEWLRREGRRIDARHALRAAHESFLAMGAGAFAARAMRELLATGERARRRIPETQSELTPQERRIATLASEGRSNPDIATTLSISPRTVEYHLHKVFIKLSISSRTELHLVLTDDR